MQQSLLCSAGCLIGAAETWLVAGAFGHVPPRLLPSPGTLFAGRGGCLMGRAAARLPQGAEGTFGCMAEARTCV